MDSKLEKELSKRFTPYMVTYFEDEGGKLHERRMDHEEASIGGEGPRMDVFGSKAADRQSEEEGGLHRVCIDIDFPINVVPSRTEGHYHLYFTDMEPVPWEKYQKFLEAAKDIGLIEEGYYNACVARRQTFLRIDPEVDLKGVSADEFLGSLTRS